MDGSESRSPESRTFSFGGLSEVVKDRLDVDYGILDKLVGSKTIPSAVLTRIKSGSGTIERSERLMDYITSEDKLEGFIGCLRRSGQTHLANYITSAGAYAAEFGGDWPLIDSQLERLDVNREVLVDMIDTVDLIGKLISKQVLNDRHNQFIASKQTNYEKMDTLLDIIRRTSNEKYQKFIECLRLSNQNHLADILSSQTAQVVIGIHCRFQEDTDHQPRHVADSSYVENNDVTSTGNDVISSGNDVDDDEDEIIRRMEDLLAKKDEAKSRKILAKLQMRLFAVKKCSSICLYFIVERLSELSLLHNLLRSGGLQTAVETVFSQVYSAGRGTRQSFRVALSYMSKDSNVRCRKFFESKTGVRVRLSQRKLDLLKVNRDFLSTFLGSKELSDDLYIDGVLDETQKREIASKGTEFERCGSFLDILEDKDTIDYRKLIRYLRRKNKEDIAEILQSGGAVARVDVDISGPDEQRTSSIIVREISIRLQDKRASGYTQLSELTRLKLVAASALGSTIDRVVLYFHLSTLEDLQHLYELIEKKELESFVESVFNSLLPSTETRRKVTQLQWNTTDYERIQHYMTEVEVNSKEVRRSISHSTEICTTTIDELPTEIMDVIILKSFLIPLCCPSGRGRGRGVGEKESVFCLSSVNYFWFERLKRRQFRRTLQRRLCEFFRRTMANVTLIRNNWKFLTENITVNSLMDKFSCTGTLSDAEIRFMKTKRLREGRKTEALIHLIHSNAYVTSASSPSSSPDQSAAAFNQNLLRSLKDSKQEQITNLLERGGVIVDVHLFDPEKLGDFTRQHEKQQSGEQLKTLVRKLNGSLSKNKWNRREQLQRELEDDGIELTGVSIDRGIVVRFFCRQRNALDKLREIFLSGQLRNILNEVLQKLSTELFHRLEDFKLAVENGEFSREAVVLRSPVKFLQSLDVRDLCVSGVTCLDSKIYVLCHSPCVIHVYDLQFPFRMLMGVPKDEIKQPSDIASSPPSNCFYVADSGSGSVSRDPEEGHEAVVWRVSPATFEAIKWISGIERPSTLSVAPDGRVLILRWGARPIMEIYSPEGCLIRAITLPSTIEYPRHVVETPHGGWIVCYWVRISKTWEVCELLGADGSGKTTKSFRRFDLRDLVKPLNHTFHLALDEYQRIFVADFSNDRVVLYDQDFRHSQVLLSESANGIVAPYRLNYHLETRRLLVVHGGRGFREIRGAWGGRFVDVYEIG